jgi:uncharacterized OB-fold protein
MNPANPTNPMTPIETINSAAPADPQAVLSWTEGGPSLVFQSCKSCRHRWYFQRKFCPVCGHTEPVQSVSSGTGSVHASTLVQRAPSDEFRAIAPYRIVLVDVAEGFRVMGHGEAELVIGDPVRCEVRQIAGRALPFFTRNHS